MYQLRSHARLAGLLALVQCGAAFPQHWNTIGLREYFSQVRQVYADTANNALYVCGLTSFAPDGGSSIYRLQDGDWDTLGVFANQVNTVMVWRDTLYASGSFWTINGEQVQGMAYYHNEAWHEVFDTYTVAQRFKVLDGELYMLGGFQTLNGEPASGIAKRVGGGWEPLPEMEGVDYCVVYDIARYQGHLYAVGNIHFEEHTYQDVLMLTDEGTWIPVGPEGLYGGFSGASACAVYQDEFYVCGYFSVNDGNAGHGIMRWNGAEWRDVGGGLLWAPGEFGITCQAGWMEVHENKLFVASGCNYAGDVPAGGMAVWDGTRWCGLAEPLDGGSLAFAFLNDTLYANEIEGPSSNLFVNTVVKYLHTEFADTCGVVLGLAPEQRASTLRAWVDAGGNVQLAGLPIGMHTLALCGMDGRICWAGDANARSDGAVRVGTGRLASGAYTLVVPGIGSVKLAIIDP